MKLVINKQFGGFGLSREAVARMAELQGRPCYFFGHHDENGKLDLDRWFPLRDQSPGADLLWSAFDVPNPNEVLAYQKDWHSKTMEERQASNELYAKHSIPQRLDNRADPLLVRVVEELGDRASGRFASLKVVEIPDGTEYVIEEYDGRESVHEAHRSWS